MATTKPAPKPIIGTLSEQSLHASLKEWYAEQGDELEVRVDGFIIDIVRQTPKGNELIEIQTRNFSSMKRKLTVLLDDHLVRLVHPVPANKWIVRQSAGGKQVGRRKSPAHGGVLNIFHELVRIPHLVAHDNLSVEVLLTHEDVILRDDGKGSWRRRKWSIHDRRLIEVVDQHLFEKNSDYCELIPDELERPFTNKSLAAVLGCQRFVAERMTYTLRKAGLLERVGKEGNAFLYEIASSQLP